MTQKYNRKKRVNSILVYIKSGDIENKLKRRDALQIVNDFYDLPENNQVNNNSWRNSSDERYVVSAIPFKELENDIRGLEPCLKGKRPEIKQYNDKNTNNNTDQNITINKSDFDNLMVRLSELEKENMILKNKLNNI